MPHAPTLTLYMHPLSSYCWKVLIALYETGAPFTAAVIHGRPAEDEAFRALWPVARMPVLRDAVRNQAVPESSVIIEYLQRHYPGPAPLIPADPDAALDVRLWDRVFDLHVHTPMQKLVRDRLTPEGRKDPAGVAEARAGLDVAYSLLEERMVAKPLRAFPQPAPGADFTLADCAAAPALFYAEAVHPFTATHPALAAYYERLLARPSVRRTIREAQPFLSWFPFHENLDRRFFSADF